MTQLFPEYRTTLGIIQVIVGVNTAFADLFVYAGLASSRRDYRSREHQYTAYKQKADEYVYLLVRRNKAGHALQARFVEML